VGLETALLLSLLHDRLVELLALETARDPQAACKLLLFKSILAGAYTAPSTSWILVQYGPKWAYMDSW
jgi:hypothetical protein